MRSTDGLKRSVEAYDLGNSIMVPVPTLGRILT
jgi:F0F1-type ATP synthase beta subunit